MHEYKQISVESHISGIEFDTYKKNIISPVILQPHMDDISL